MGLTTWKDAPTGKIQKFDVVVAKNYLTETEMAQLQRLVSACLDVAEDLALRQIPMTMQDWETRLNRFIAATDRAVSLLLAMTAAGLDAAALEQIRANYARDVAILPPDRVAALAEAGGFAPPLRFHQAGMIHGWCARKQS